MLSGPGQTHPELSKPSDERSALSVFPANANTSIPLHHFRLYGSKPARQRKNKQPVGERQDFACQPGRGFNSGMHSVSIPNASKGVFLEYLLRDLLDKPVGVSSKEPLKDAGDDDGRGFTVRRRGGKLLFNVNV